MKHIPAAMALLLAAVIIIAVMAGPATAVTGGLTSADGGILGDGQWINPGHTTLNWEVTQLMSGLWRYEYTLTVPTSGISHFIISTSANFTKDEIDPANTNWNYNDLEVGFFGQGGSNPNIPATLYGLKFDEVGDQRTATFWLEVARDPVWGDFYAKGGRSPGGEVKIFNQAWNSGFDGEAPKISIFSQDLSDTRVAVPDTTYTPSEIIPEAGTLALAAMGMLSIAGLKLRRK